MEAKGVISKENFYSSLKEFPLPWHLKKDGMRKYALEGYLFPDTYEFKKGMQGKDIISMMLNRFEYEISDIRKKYKVDNSEIDNVVIIASIVEREAEKKNERGIIVSVFYNRLNNKMKLQFCVTVLYALGKHKDKLFNKDLEVGSPYNTYKVDGLPAGPIGSPGRESLLVSISPPHTNYLYFVSKNDGTHFFTNDYNKFLQVKKTTQGF